MHLITDEAASWRLPLLSRGGLVAPLPRHVSLQDGGNRPGVRHDGLRRKEVSEQLPSGWSPAPTKTPTAAAASPVLRPRIALGEDTSSIPRAACWELLTTRQHHFLGTDGAFALLGVQDS